jgi:WD40 repeat protein
MQVGGLRDFSVVTGGSDCAVKVWDTRSLSSGSRLTLNGHNKIITSLKWDWMKIVSGSRDNTVKIWDTSTGACLFSSATDVFSVSEDYFIVFI